MKKHPSILCQYMVFLKCLLTIHVFTIVKHLDCMHLMEFYLIMSLQEEAQHLLQKIIQALVRIKNKKQKLLTLGNLYAVRDWGMQRIMLKVCKILQYKT